MRTQPWLLASALGLVACAATEPDRPRIYYPRNIKREYINSTVTSHDSTAPPDTTSDAHESTTKRDGLGLGGVVSGIIGGLGNQRPKSVTTIVVDSTVHVPAKPHKTESGIVVGPSGIVKTKSKTKAADPTTTSHHGLLDPVGSLVSGLLGGDPTSTNTTDPGKPPKTDTAKPTSTSHHGLLDGLTSLLNPDPPKTSDPPKTKTKDTETKETTTTHHGLIPPLSSLLPIPPLVSSTTSSSDNESEPATQTSAPPTETPTWSVPTETPTMSVPDVPVVNSTSSEDTSAPTELPTTNLTNPGDATSTSAPAPTSAPATTSEAPTASAEPSTAIPSTESGDGVTSIMPTATLTNTNWLPSTIVAEPTQFSFTRPTAAPTGSSSHSIPTSVPRVILPDDHDPNQPPPEGSELIHIGFLFPLNYLFVAHNTVAAAQIFKYLPKALADAGGFPVEKVMINRLVPYDSMDTWGYLTTIAQVYYPKTLVDTLQMDLWAPASGIYNVGDTITRNLTAVINPKIDIYGNVEDPNGNGGGNGGSGGNNSGDDPFSGNNDNQTSKQKATTAGIAVGAVGLSVAYGAAMFIVARRYKRKRQAHQRSSSVGSSHASSEMRYTGAGSPALMGGALLSRDLSSYGGVAGGRNSHNSHGSGRSGASNSARTANISAPLSAENSLGWN